MAPFRNVVLGLGTGAIRKLDCDPSEDGDAAYATASDFMGCGVIDRIAECHLIEGRVDYGITMKRGPGRGTTETTAMLPPRPLIGPGVEGRSRRSLAHAFYAREPAVAVTVFSMPGTCGLRVFPEPAVLGDSATATAAARRWFDGGQTQGDRHGRSPDPMFCRLRFHLVSSRRTLRALWPVVFVNDTRGAIRSPQRAAFFRDSRLSPRPAGPVRK